MADENEGPSKIKIIFLDIDGVFVSRASARIFRNYDHFLPASVAWFNRVLEATGAQIVISSAWRIKHTKEELIGIFREQGIEGAILDVTPNLGTIRGKEIEAWLKNTKFSIQSFIIIDDDNDLEPYLDRLVKTTWKEGFLDEHMDAAIQMLNS